ncbi:MAG: type II toxin-antitoxin system prevent-host-death family antitoxin [Patescibacteria group bacterium]
MKQTTIIGLKELRENTKDFIKEVGKGKTFTVVRRSQPIFKIAPVDQWGDDGLWETVVDFGAIKKEGILARDVLKLLRNRSNGQNNKISQ